MSWKHGFPTLYTFTINLSKCSFGFSGQSLLLLDTDTGRMAHSMSLKMVCASIMALCFGCFAHYSADLTALMTSASGVTSVNSFDKALDEGYTVLVKPNTSDDTYLKTAPRNSGRYRYDLLAYSTLYVMYGRRR